jgi:hypothetical protein
VNRQQLGISVLAVPAALLTIAASTPPPVAPPTTAPTPTPTSVIDPVCAFTNGCTSPTPSPNAGVLGAGTGVPTPATGANAGLLAGLGSLPAVALGIAAIRWSRRRR